MRATIEGNFPVAGDTLLGFQDGVPIHLARGLMAMYEQKPHEATSNLEPIESIVPHFS